MIGVYMHPEAMTIEQYNGVDAMIDAEGISETGRRVHTCFGDDGDLSVFDVWESREAFDAFVSALAPLLADAGIEFTPPEIVAIVACDLRP